MPGSSTTPGRPGARAGAPVRIAFRDLKRVGARDRTSFAAQWLACALPCRRFDLTLADAAARLRGRGGSLRLPRGALAPPVSRRTQINTRYNGVRLDLLLSFHLFGIGRLLPLTRLLLHHARIGENDAAA